MNSPAGQAAIRLREALLVGDLDTALAQLVEVDGPHRVEVLLGGALRHGAAGFAAVGAWRLAATHSYEHPAWRTLCARLASPSSSGHDEWAAAWVASGLAPEGVPRGGQTVPPATARRFAGPDAEAALLDALRGGSGVSDVLTVWPAHPLLEPVRAYYGAAIGALGPRPLLYLAIVPASAAYAA